MAHIQIALKVNAMSNKLTSLSERVERDYQKYKSGMCEAGALESIAGYNNFLKTPASWIFPSHQSPFWLETQFLCKLGFPRLDIEMDRRYTWLDEFTR